MRVLKGWKRKYNSINEFNKNTKVRIKKWEEFKDVNYEELDYKPFTGLTDEEYFTNNYYKEGVHEISNVVKGEKTSSYAKIGNKSYNLYELEIVE